MSVHLKCVHGVGLQKSEENIRRKEIVTTREALIVNPIKQEVKNVMGNLVKKVGAADARFRAGKETAGKK